MAGNNVFLVSSEPGTYERTVASAVELSEYSNRPEPLDALDEARLWGVGDGDRNRTYFEKMEAGDLLLFHRDGVYVGVGYVGTTFEDDDGWVNATVWEADLFEQIYTIEAFTEISVPQDKLNRIFDYTAEYAPQGLTRVADSRVTNRLEAIKLAVERASA